MNTTKTNSPASVDWNVEERTANDLSTDGGRRTTDDVWRCVQRGLVYPSPYAIFVTSPVGGCGIGGEYLGRPTMACSRLRACDI
jgi:hypothetical protein